MKEEKIGKVEPADSSVSSPALEPTRIMTEEKAKQITELEDKIKKIENIIAEKTTEKERLTQSLQKYQEKLEELLNNPEEIESLKKKRKEEIKYLKGSFFIFGNIPSTREELKKINKDIDLAERDLRQAKDTLQELKEGETLKAKERKPLLTKKGLVQAVTTGLAIGAAGIETAVDVGNNTNWGVKTEGITQPYAKKKERQFYMSEAKNLHEEAKRLQETKIKQREDKKPEPSTPKAENKEPTPLKVETPAPKVENKEPTPPIPKAPTIEEIRTKLEAEYAKKLEEFKRTNAAPSTPIVETKPTVFTKEMRLEKIAEQIRKAQKEGIDLNQVLDADDAMFYQQEQERRLRQEQREREESQKKLEKEVKK